jgi:flagellar hook-length control protein FliK
MLAVNTNVVLSTGPADGASDGLRPAADQSEPSSAFALELLSSELLHSAWPAEATTDQSEPAEQALTVTDTATASVAEVQGQEAEQPLLQAEELLVSLLLQQQMLLHPQPPAAAVSPQGGLLVPASSAQMASGRHLGRNLPGADTAPALSASSPSGADTPVLSAPVALAADTLPMEARMQGVEELASTSTAPRPSAELAAQRPELPSARPLTAEARLHLQGPESRWGEQMLNALRDSVELQLKQNKQQAIIRLDPAELGSLEIRLSQESGRLQVQIHAAQGDVVRLLQQTIERLRHDLATPEFSQIDVQVGSQSQSGQRQSSPFDQGAVEQNPSANNRVDATEHSGSRLRSDVLVSV